MAAFRASNLAIAQLFNYLLWQSRIAKRKKEEDEMSDDTQRGKFPSTMSTGAPA